jgi:hypothetical protein
MARHSAHWKEPMSQSYRLNSGPEPDGGTCPEPHLPTGNARTLLGLRHDEVVLPVLLQALPLLRLFRSENPGDLGVVFVVNRP